MTTDTAATARPKPVVLCILDGWGYREERDNNAIALADTPTWDRMMAENPRSMVETGGLAVGLPDGQMGNSEVGHMNLGSGRVILQDLPRIDTAIADGSLARNPVLTALIDKLSASGGTCHLMGLLSPGGVHSHMDHMLALAKIVAGAGVPVAVHAFLDGRDTPPKSAAGYMADFLAGLPDGARMGSLSGRYYAMDRDNRWDRVEKAFRAMVRPAAADAPADPVAVINASYAADVTDEFLDPTGLAGNTGMADGDGVLVANFRADRAREITAALLDPSFDGFDRGTPVAFAAAAAMTSYSDAHNAWLDVLFGAEDLPDVLGEVLSGAGLKQLRIAETEKYAHVTFFFNGGRETPFDGEDRILIPSPKVATYDLAPAMSAVEVTDNIVRVIDEGVYDVIIVNYANGDMVGHTGILAAAIEAAGVIDGCLARLEKSLLAAGGTMIVTADHGNCEQMVDPQSGGPHTAHTTGAVATVLVGAPKGVQGLADGRLSDLAPTMLDLLGLPRPAAMNGHSLLTRQGVADRAAE